MLCAAFISTYVVVSKYSRKHFISENYTTVQLFKLHFRQNHIFIQLYTFSSDGKGGGNIPGNHFVKAP
jgi:aspartyl aminopeptidase